MRCLLLLAALATPAAAQWTIQSAPTTADLRGIDNVGKGIAWASGTDGTVLRTEDNGYLWQRCTTPPNADHLDFRGIQAFDANTAIVMSSGKGDLSRLYKTTDGCQTWKLVFSNPDKEGFFDALRLNIPSLRNPIYHATDQFDSGYVLGDPIDGHFALFETHDAGNTWARRYSPNRDSDGGGCKIDHFKAERNEAAFAASNQALLLPVIGYPTIVFVTGGDKPSMHFNDLFSLDGSLCHESTHQFHLPLVPRNASAGAFAIASSPQSEGIAAWYGNYVVVGGDYEKPDSNEGTASTITRLGPALMRRVLAATTPPHGYRSAVAYDAPTKTWITVGPNGTDISTDDGRNWRPLKPSPTDTPDADQHWNALSLPFVVGPHGRIGILNPTALGPGIKTPGQAR